VERKWKASLFEGRAGGRESDAISVAVAIAVAIAVTIAVAVTDASGICRFFGPGIAIARTIAVTIAITIALAGVLESARIGHASGRAADGNGEQGSGEIDGGGSFHGGSLKRKDGAHWSSRAHLGVPRRARKGDDTKK